MRARVRGSRQQSIRGLLSLTLVVPLVCLIALWTFGVSVTVTHAAAEHDFTVADRLYSGPAQALSAALMAERLQAVSWLSGGRTAPVASLDASVRDTDQAADSFLAAARTDQPAMPAAARSALPSMKSVLTARTAVLANVESGRVSPLDAAQSYGTILSAVNVFDAKLLVVDDASLARQSAATVVADRGVELAGEELALVSAAAAASGAMSTAERSLFVQDMTGAQLMTNSALAVLDRSLSSGFLTARNSAAYRRFAAIETEITATVGAAGPVPVDATTLAATVTPLSSDYQAAERQDAAGLGSLAAQAASQATMLVMLVTWLGLVAVVLSVALVARLWWRVTREVTGLQAAALALTGERLPQLTVGPSQADGGDASAEEVPIPASRIVEIDRTRAALALAQHLALQATAAQSQLRGASRFFGNLGLRTQVLADRQLRLLRWIERGVGDPQTRAGLAAVGQLSNQIHRQADGLLVLSGLSPPRDEQRPLPVVELIRAATADMDDGSRIAVVTDTTDAIAAGAAPDVTHLVAELVENAVRHTPPLTEVTVRVGRVGRGLVIEVEDRGPGIAEQELESANALLAAPPAPGVVVGERLGMLVVARLAARNGITVTLRRSPFAGTAAIVLLPHAILVAGEVQDTIVDGSLPRVDAGSPPPGLPAPDLPESSLPPLSGPPPDSGPAPLPRRKVDPKAQRPVRGVDPDVPAEPTAAAEPGAPAESTAPWHWLTASQPARPGGPDPASGPAAPASDPSTVPTSAADTTLASDRSDSAAPTPLPRRIRQGTAASGGIDRAAAASASSDQPSSPDATGTPNETRSEADGPGAGRADESAGEP
jgi:signal transduction histidine kinase